MSNKSVTAAEALWKEVGNGIDGKSLKVFYSKKVLDALEYVIIYQESKEAQRFGDKYMKPIVDTILGQKIVSGEKKNQTIVAILRTSVDIAGKNLISNSDGKCTLDAIASIFDKTKTYYDGDSESSGNPGVRVDMIKRFGHSSRKGFHHLATRLALQSSEFPNMDTLHLLLLASVEAAFVMNLDEALRRISRATMDHLIGLDDLTKYPTQSIYLVRRDLQRLCKKLSLSTPQIMSDFNQFWRSLTLQLLISDSQLHKLFGLKEIENLIAACRIPESYIVKGAGSEIVNGRYEVSSSVITNGYVSSQTVTYERKSDCGEKLTIQPCLMTEPGKSHCDVWYFLSNAKGVDYYFHETSPDEEDNPPLVGWKRIGGNRHPPPTLEQSTNTIPFKDEKGNLEKQFSKWAVENDVYGIILGRCIDENHLQASASLRNFLSKMNTPNLTSEQLVLSNSLGQGASLLESILPLLTSTGPIIMSQSQPVQSIPSSASSYTAAIAAAKQRLISAQRWKDSMESALQGYIDASRELQIARSSLLDLERNHGIIEVDADDEDEEPQAKRSKTKTS
eukprot:CAMPEP_0201719054 /NCGR_PEP_ID=MMETSP0593-20130828/4384_1 /ASSEMBLY_ACC=CAM_ASM_000672 /TAXON_ID=267983 /ORGANISM="Skeletonema japonicum, Strain CCMP2506" /LENGTH=562 /DNA_ID=CAMNT_0048209445 /DNA_START=156 /DNA_END=1844 /DNA_ORIENTATION=-